MNQTQTATSAGIDFAWMIDRAKSVLTNPGGAWTAIKQDNHTVKDVYIKYLAVMAALGPLCTLIGMSLFTSGQGMPAMAVGMTATIGLVVITYVTQLIVPYISAWIIKMLAPNFDGSPSLVDSLKLSVYSSTPSYVGAILGIFPPLRIIGSLFGLYGIYVYYKGIPEMTGVPASKQVLFAIVSIIVIFIAMLVISAVLMAAIAGLFFAGAGSAALIN